MALIIEGGITIGGGISVGAGGALPPSPSTTFFPMSHTSSDPTTFGWQSSNPGYTFTPNVGITTLTPMTDASFMFYGVTGFNESDLSLWNTSSITNMSSMFTAAVDFNTDISGWNISNVTNIQDMFNGATNFNSNISGWNTSNVTNMTGVFTAASAFNCGQASGVAHNLMQRTAGAGWQVENVTTMDQMFQDSTAFNGNISDWCVTTISTTPSAFATGANANFVTGRQPTWGSCPFPNV